jgi:DNA-directed primase/polymerase protein
MDEALPCNSVSPRARKESSLDWRNEHEAENEGNRKKKSSSRSRGVSPKRFYGDCRSTDKGLTNNANAAAGLPPPPRRRNRAVAALHSSIQDRYLKHQQSRVCQELEVRRSAFRQLTCLTTHPLQDMAVAHYSELLQIHLGQHPLPSSDSGKPSADQVRAAEEASSVSSAQGASSSSSGVSLDADIERKRTLRDALLSPTKSRLKALFRNEFLEQQSVGRRRPPAPAAVSSVTAFRASSEPFGPALWCMEPRVFSVEKSKTGKRRYLTGHYGRFADLYWRKQGPTSRNFYEVILENTPCRLYLDLEFAKTNHQRTESAEQLLDELFRELQAEWSEAFPHTDPLLRSHVVDLDSSTPSKFSRHWIVHSDPYLFANTSAVGQFVTNWIGRLANEQATGQLETTKGRTALQSYLLDDDQACVVDMGVYTRNRLFRLLGSCKFGKNPHEATLRIAGSNQFPLGITNDMFLATAAAAKSSTTEEADVDEKVEHFVQATDWTMHAQALADTLVIPLNATKIGYLLLPYDEEQATLPARGPEATAESSQRVASGRSGRSKGTRGPSPYPALDEYVQGVLCQRGCEDGLASPGSIRTWSIEQKQGAGSTAPQHSIITYFLAGNRWCERVQRAHKSNGIYWVVDLTRFTCTQCCFDPDCRTFRGSPLALPPRIRDELSESLFEEALAALNIEESASVSPRPSGSTIDDDDPLSDELLLSALQSNPELFP